MKKETTLRKVILLLTVLMSATLLYGGYQVRQEAGMKGQYESKVRQKAMQINKTICKEIDQGQAGCVPQEPIRFLRVCAEDL
jgi:hypothetical protein